MLVFSGETDLISWHPEKNRNISLMYVLNNLLYKHLHFFLCMLIHMQRTKFCLKEKLKVIYLSKDSWTVIELIFLWAKRKGEGSLRHSKWQFKILIIWNLRLLIPQRLEMTSRTRHIRKMLPLLWKSRIPKKLFQQAEPLVYRINDFVTRFFYFPPIVK